MTCTASRGTTACTAGCTARTSSWRARGGGGDSVSRHLGWRERERARGPQVTHNGGATWTSETPNALVTASGAAGLIKSFSNVPTTH